MISKRHLGGVALTCALVITLGPGAGSTLAADTGLTPYAVEITDGSVLQTLAEEGFDTVEGRVGDTLEIAATPAQVAALEKQGVEAELKGGARPPATSGLRAFSPMAPIGSTAPTSTTNARRRAPAIATSAVATTGTLV